MQTAVGGHSVSSFPSMKFPAEPVATISRRHNRAISKRHTLRMSPNRLFAYMPSDAFQTWHYGHTMRTKAKSHPENNQRQRGRRSPRGTTLLPEHE